MAVDHAMVQQYCATQGGVLSFEQADLCGVTRPMARRRITAGQWIRLLPNVISTVGLPDDLARTHAAMLWAGAGSVLVGESALWWWGLQPKAPDQVSLVVPDHRPRKSAGFVRVRRFRVPDADRVTERGIRVVSKPYALLFAGRELGPRAQPLLDRALLREFDLDQFRRILDRNERCLGAKHARVLLRAAGDGAAAESERRLIRLLRGAGIEGWVVNRRRRIAGATVIPDFTFERERVVVEVDGWAFHSDPERFERDRIRQNTFVSAGWIVLRFTWVQLHDRPQEVVATIAAALASRTGQN